jgi:hypothetical protein
VAFASPSRSRGSKGLHYQRHHSLFSGFAHSDKLLFGNNQSTSAKILEGIEDMKKISVGLILVAAMSVPATGAFAATSTPKPHITGAAAAPEGSATHEMSETAGTQKSEGKGMTLTHKATTKKAKKAKKK